MAKLPDGRALPGTLFIVEGIDGSGKSTQLDVLRKWLIGQGYCVAFSKWNSSPIVRNTTRRGKKKHLLTPTSFSLIYTAFARDVARGVHPQWVREVYSFAIQPTVAFYFRVPMDESLERIPRGG